MGSELSNDSNIDSAYYNSIFYLWSNCSCLCYTQEQEQPWWNSSLHVVHHFHLTTPETLKFEIEVVKGERKTSLQPGRVEKEPSVSIMIKGYLFHLVAFSKVRLIV